VPISARNVVSLTLQTAVVFRSFAVYTADVISRHRRPSYGIVCRSISGSQTSATLAHLSADFANIIHTHFTAVICHVLSPVFAKFDKLVRSVAPLLWFYHVEQKTAPNDCSHNFVKPRLILISFGKYVL